MGSIILRLLFGGDGGGLASSVHDSLSVGFRVTPVRTNPKLVPGAPVCGSFGGATDVVSACRRSAAASTTTTTHEGKKDEKAQVRLGPEEGERSEKEPVTRQALTGTNSKREEE